MNLTINRKSTTPVFLQIYQQIRHQILSGELELGTRLPGSRDLAKFFHVNRNTINNAVKVLERDGLIEIRPGLGMYVSDNPGRNSQHHNELYGLAQETVKRLHELGGSIEDFIPYLYLLDTGLDDGGSGREQKYIVFVECNRPVLESYRADIEKGVGIRVVPLLISEIREAGSDLSGLLEGAEIIVTTFTHFHEVKRLLPECPVDIVGVSAGQYIDLMLTIAKLSHRGPISVVTMIREGAEEVAESILDAGFGFEKIDFYGLDADDAERRVRDAQTLVMSRAAYNTAREMLSPEQEVLIYENVLDRAGLNMLKKLLRSEDSTDVS